MEASCQRCHEPLREADRYCPVCGLPQLTYVAAEAQVIAGIESEGGPNPGVTSSLPGGGVVWQPALKAALMLAVPAGVLCSRLSPIGDSLLGLLWMMGAAAWAVNIYVRRSRSARLTAGAGARIGLVTGLFASWLSLGVDGVLLWVARFLQHQGSQMDSAWLAETEQKLAANQQMMMQIGFASAQALQSTQMTRSIVLSVEGKAGIVLSELVTGSVFLVVFAVIGGAMGARFLTHPRSRGV